MKIIVINGGASVGKDKFVEIFTNLSNFRVKNYSSVDKIKHISEMCFGWNGKKDEKSRKFLSDVKRAWSEFNDGPTNDILNRIEIDIKYCIENGKNIENNVYFVHIREPEEIAKIQKIYGDNCITLIINKNVDIHPDNSSDKNVNNYEYQYTIDNNSGLEELNEKVKQFITNII